MAAFAEIIDLGTVQGDRPVRASRPRPAILERHVAKVIDQYNDPGVFSTLAGFEWTFTPQGDNLHRIVLFRDGAERTGQTRPFSFFDAPEPEKLWDYLAAYEAKTGGRAIAVPHNGNLPQRADVRRSSSTARRWTRTTRRSASAGNRSTR